MASVLTLKEFREKTKDLPETTKIVTYTNDMEVRNAVCNAHVNVTKMIQTKQECVDAFDYTRFSVDTYKKDENGEEVIYIRG